MHPLRLVVWHGRRIHSTLSYWITKHCVQDGESCCSSRLYSFFGKAYGDANKQAHIVNNVDTKFNLGSINKLFTQICINQLVGEGKLSYGDKLGKFIPDYPNKEAAAKVTVRELPEISSGIGDFFGERFQTTPKDKIRTLNDYLPLFADKPLLFEPGTQRRYSNGGYVVLGLIIQKASGQDYYDYVRQHVFLPAGMEDTNFYFTDQQVPNRAEGYTHEEAGERKWKNNRFTRPARGSSAVVAIPPPQIC